MTPSPRKSFQFGLGKVVAVVVVAAFMCWALEFSKGARILSLIALGSAAGILFGPSTVRGSTLCGGIGGALGYWLILPHSLVTEPMRGPFKFGVGIMPGLIVASACIMVMGFILGSGIGAMAGHLRQWKANDESAATLIDRLRSQRLD